MEKISIAGLKRFFQSNIGRKIEAEWPEIRIVGNLGVVEQKFPRTKRVIKAVKGNEVLFDTEKGVSYLHFGKGDYAYIGNGVIEIYSGEDNKLAVRYFVK